MISADEWTLIVRMTPSSKSAPIAPSQDTSSNNVGENTRAYGQRARRLLRAKPPFFRPGIACNPLPPRLTAWNAGPRGLLGRIRAGLLLREISRLAIGERVRAGPRWAGVPPEVVPPGAYSDPMVMHVGILKKNGELRPSVWAAVVSYLAESLGWSPTTWSPL